MHNSDVVHLPTMNGDTITVNPTSHKGHRAKRIKIEQAIARSNVTTRRTVSERMSRNSAIHGAIAEPVQGSNSNGLHNSSPSQSTNGTSARVTQILPAGHASGEERNREYSIPATLLTPELAEQASQNSPDSPSNIDFQNAPSDPIELAWWVAQQITHFHGGQLGSPEVEADEETLGVISHPPGVHTRRSATDLEPLQVEERERLRGENRERKKRWREINAERST